MPHLCNILHLLHKPTELNGVRRYPTCVATLSRRSKDVIEAGFERSVEGGGANPLLGSRLHDFGFRGCTCVEQTVLGGCAHLLNFDGTDTMSAAYYAQVILQFTLAVRALLGPFQGFVSAMHPLNQCNRPQHKYLL